MIELIGVYLIIGLIILVISKTHYRQTKRTVPMWFVNLQLIVGWLPLLVYNIFNQK